MNEFDFATEDGTASSSSLLRINCVPAITAEWTPSRTLRVCLGFQGGTHHKLISYSNPPIELNYSIYADPSFNQVIGTLPHQAAVFDFPLTGQSVNRDLGPIYIKIPAGQTVPAGDYSYNYAYDSSKAYIYARFYATGTPPPACENSYPFNGIASNQPLYVATRQKSICEVTSVSNIDFGVHAPLGMGDTLYATGAVSVKCNAGAYYGIGFGEGLHYDDEITGLNRMKASSTESFIHYSLTPLSDSYNSEGGYSTWIPNFINTDGFPLSHTLEATAYVPANSPIGSYSDTVVLTVAY